MTPIGTYLRRARKNPVDPASLLFIGGAAFVLWLIGKKKKRRGAPGVITDPCRTPDCGPGDVTIPPPNTGPSDPLPPGSGGGHLPKGGGYKPPPMGPDQLWIADDCQAFVYGSEWYPTTAGKDAYMWFTDYIFTGTPEWDWADWWREYYSGRVGEIIQEGGVEPDNHAHALKMWSWGVVPGDSISGFFQGRFPDWPSQYTTIKQTIPEPTFAFAEEVLGELAPQCAPPRWRDYETASEWVADYTAWRRKFPRMALLFDQTMALGAEGPFPVGQNFNTGTEESYQGVRNMWNAHLDQLGIAKGHIDPIS